MHKITLLIAAAAAVVAAFMFAPRSEASPLLPSGIAMQSQALPSPTIDVRYGGWHRHWHRAWHRGHWRRHHWRRHHWHPHWRAHRWHHWHHHRHWRW